MTFRTIEDLDRRLAQILELVPFRANEVRFWWVCMATVAHTPELREACRARAAALAEPRRCRR